MLPNRLQQTATDCNRLQHTVSISASDATKQRLCLCLYRFLCFYLCLCLCLFFCFYLCLRCYQTDCNRLQQTATKCFYLSLRCYQTETLSLSQTLSHFPLKLLHPQNPPNRETKSSRYLALQIQIETLI